MQTDPARVRRTDPGDPEKCPVFDYHKVVSPLEVQQWSANGCRTAGIGCLECKRAMADHLMPILKPIQERRRQYEESPRKAWDILEEGDARARKAAERTMAEVREAMNLTNSFPEPKPAAR
jgi:tryptophanyl-tRNA synthetase